MKQDLDRLVDRAKKAVTGTFLPDTCRTDAFSALFARTLNLLDRRHQDAIKYAEAVADFSHERLVAGPLNLSTQNDRMLFSQASLVKALAIIQEGEYKEEEDFQLYAEALETLDKAFLLTGQLSLPDITTDLIECLTEILASKRKQSESCSTSPASNQPTLGKERDSIHLVSPLPILEKPPSILQFVKHHQTSQSPILIKKAISHWPALQERSWADVEYLRRLAGPRKVPIEIGSQYTDNDWTQRLVSFDEFLDKYIFDPSPQEGVGYLAQHDIFRQIPALQRDIMIPDYCSACSDNDAMEIKVNAWFGPRRTVSPLHHDPHDNLLGQVVGHKYVRLYSPKNTGYLYPFDSQSMLSNTSQVNAEAPDEQKFPLFASAPFLECMLEPGDLLYIPKGWWHYVRSLSVSFSVSFWF
ncbi:hypothetical protein DFS34DRAFT_647554 [Phlyctochytrium arcticum]|nr:hypothetical protein DFS34DRAFT_647554 [Phlyctochytrium arcticum]